MRKSTLVIGLALLTGACGFVTFGPRFGTGAPHEGNGICGTTTVIGALAEPVGSGACGIANPVRIISVAGVRLSQPATLSCEAVRALEQWTQRTAIPAVGGRHGGLAELTVAGSYSCRGRNGVAGARLSEHAFGKAIDISGFKTGDGTRVTVKGDWSFWKFWGSARALKHMRRGACGPFNTVLGPGSDSYHRDHLHMDVGDQNGGRYCR